MAAEGCEPVGGTTRLPMEAAGGGPICAESSRRIGNVVLYYAKSQNADLLLPGDEPHSPEKRQCCEFCMNCDTLYRGVWKKF